MDTKVGFLNRENVVGGVMEGNKEVISSKFLLMLWEGTRRVASYWDLF